MKKYVVLGAITLLIVIVDATSNMKEGSHLSNLITENIEALATIEESDAKWTVILHSCPYPIEHEQYVTCQSGGNEECEEDFPNCN